MLRGRLCVMRRRLRRMAHRLLPFIRLLLLVLLLVVLLLVLLLWGTFGRRSAEEIEDAFQHVKKPHNCG